MELPAKVVDVVSASRAVGSLAGGTGFANMQAKLGIETDPRSASEAALRNGPESSEAMQPPEGKC